MIPRSDAVIGSQGTVINSHIVFFEAAPLSYAHCRGKTNGACARKQKMCKDLWMAPHGGGAPQRSLNVQFRIRRQVFPPAVILRRARSLSISSRGDVPVSAPENPIEKQREHCRFCQTNVAGNTVLW